MDKVITGDWDGEPIWRPKTPAEKLSDLLDEEITKKNMTTATGGSEYTNMALGEIELQAREVQGEWDGDNAGEQEDRAMIAEDILEAVKNLEELMGELEL